MLKRILTVVGWTVGNPAAMAFLRPEEDALLTIGLSSVVGLVVVATAVLMARRPRHVRR